MKQNSRRELAGERRLEELLRIEQQMRSRGIRLIAGVDEAGRGPLAGPVVAAAVLFPPGTRIRGVDDSKRLSPEERAELYDVITGTALAVGVGMADHIRIDLINILNATFEAMRGALDTLAVHPDHALIDGDRFRGGPCPFTTVVGGDALCFSVAAASIVAKVTRDRLMTGFDAEYPGYGFARHKGYGTPEHREALLRLGPCAIHRKSFLSNFRLGPVEGEPEERGKTETDRHNLPPVELVKGRGGASAKEQPA